MCMCEWRSIQCNSSKCDSLYKWNMRLRKWVCEWYNDMLGDDMNSIRQGYYCRERYSWLNALRAFRQNIVSLCTSWLNVYLKYEYHHSESKFFKFVGSVSIPGCLLWYWCSISSSMGKSEIYVTNFIVVHKGQIYNISASTQSSGDPVLWLIYTSACCNMLKIHFILIESYSL